MSSTIPKYKEYMIFIYDKSVYTSIHDFLLKQYYPYLKTKSVTILGSIPSWCNFYFIIKINYKILNIKLFSFF